MQLQDLFSASDLVVDFEPIDKWGAIRQLVDHMVKKRRIAGDSAAAVQDALEVRERSMTTGMEHGIAMPHAAVDEVEEVVAAMGIVHRDEGLAFDSIDGRPTRLVVLLVIPRTQKLLHIRTLADVARALQQESLRGALIAARDAEHAHAALVAAEAAGI